MKITLIGSGNVAWHFGKALSRAGHSIQSIYSRNKDNAQELASLFSGCKVLSTTNFSTIDSDLFIVAVSDNAMEELASKIILPENSIIVHTSGSIPMEVFSRFSNHGVLYALQTFTKDKEMSLSAVPFGIEASDDQTFFTLQSLALSLSNNVQVINSAQRKVLHIAAVFACNFTNYMFSVSETILKKDNLSFLLLESLVKETVQKAFKIGPKRSQTGPAVRGDEKIIHQHLDYLQNEPDLRKIYQLITEAIQKG